jgi:hypothetical protein
MFERENDELGDVKGIPWWAGWNRIGTIVIGAVLFYPLTFIFTSAGLGIFLALVCGVGIWLFGVWYVNQNYEGVLNEYRDYVRRRTEGLTSKANEGVNSYTLTYSSDGPWLVAPARLYYSTNLLIDDASVEIHEGVGLDMSERAPYLNDESREVYYDQVSSVSYTRPVLEINTADGDTLEYRSSREPDDALNDLQHRIRTYKTEAPA